MKEQGRRHMQELSTFTFQRWAVHRSNSRYWRHMSGVFQSHLVRGLAKPVTLAGTMAAAVCTYETLLQDGVLPTYLPSLLLPTLPFDITSFALSLLLVFRTNTSHDRWLQGLTAWGDIATRSRDTLRQLLTYSQAPSHNANAAAAAAVGAAAGAAGASAEPAQAASATAKWLVAFVRALKDELTEDADLSAELQGVLTGEELELLLAAQHRPSFALAVLSELVAAAPLRDAQRTRLDENLTFFAGCVGTCERILRTPIPLSYTRHTSRFMVIWLSCLPLGLWSAMGWGTIPLTLVVSFLLLGIEEIGVAIEEPFSILPLEELCREIEWDLTEILDQATPSKRAAQHAAAAAMAAATAKPAVTPARRGRRAAGSKAAAQSKSAGSGGSGAAGSATTDEPKQLSGAATTRSGSAANAVAPFSRRAPSKQRPRLAAPAARSADAVLSSMD